MAAIRLVRHATLLVEVGDVTVLVDPMLSEAGALDPIPNTPNDRRNPLVGLPDVPLDADVVAVTHTHVDHFDDAAAEGLPADVPVLCQPADVDEIRTAGFEDVRPVEPSTTVGAIAVTRTGGRHGHDDLAEAMGPVSGFVFEAPGEPTVLVAGDTVWCDALEAALETHRPDAVVVNAGGARFVRGEPITMTVEDVRRVVAAVPEATVLAVHLEAINHCLLRREALRSAVPDVTIPADGERVVLD